MIVNEFKCIDGNFLIYFKEVIFSFNKAIKDLKEISENFKKSYEEN